MSSGGGLRGETAIVGVAESDLGEVGAGRDSIELAAQSGDAEVLIELARRTVHEKFRINLELEVKLVGFSNDVLREVYL